MSYRIALLLGAALTLALTGCGQAMTAFDPRCDAEPTPSPGPATAPVRIVATDDADLILHVSNQSFIDDLVLLTVTIDGTTVVDGCFAVEGQHNFYSFGLELPPGRHTLHAEANTGVSLDREFSTSGRKPRYALLDYWHYRDEGRHLSWEIQNSPMYFG